MHKQILRSTSVTELVTSMGLGQPAHPLIALIDSAKLAYGEEMVGVRFSSEMYCIALKDAGCGIDYGKNHYDFSKGALIFTAPRQVFRVTKPQRFNQSQGWMLYFHPDLIRNTPLGDKIDRYRFFNYEVFDALYLSDEEQETLVDLVKLIDKEIHRGRDYHTNQVLVSHLELILNYSLRFYERQMHTRIEQCSDVVSKVELLLKNYYSSYDLIEAGQPTIQYLAEHCHLSPSYLSDLLAKETGRSAKEHINDFLIDKGKHLLLISQDSVSSIAYSLGFNYPHYFGRLFKQKTGFTPQVYRKENSQIWDL